MSWDRVQQNSMNDCRPERGEDVPSDTCQRYRAIFECARDGIFVLDGARCIECNRSGLQMFGATLDDVLGRTPTDFSPDLQPDGRRSADAAGERISAALDGNAQFFEWRSVRKDGTPFDTEVSLSRFANDGRFLLVAVLRDVTARKQSEEDLRLEKDLFRRLVQRSPSFIVAIGSDLKTVLVNDTMLNALGYRSEEVAGKDYLETFVPEPERADLKALFMKIVARSAVAAYENHVLARDGREVLCEWHTIPVFSGERHDFFLGVGLDITEARRVAQERLAAEREAHEAAERVMTMREEFLAVAAHELRTPMTSLLLALQSLGRRVKEGRFGDPPSLERMISVAEHQAASLSVLSETLIEASSIAGGALPLVLSKVDLGDAITTAVERLSGALKASGSHLQLDVRTPIIGYWDRARIEQVVVNLLSNAIKYGEGKPIEIWARAEDRVARLVVRDHGMGIAPEDQRRIFGPFERAASPRHYGGLGLGLYTAQRIVVSLGGTLEIESAPHKGSTFTVTLPCGSAPGK